MHLNNVEYLLMLMFICSDCPSGSVGGDVCQRPSSLIWTPHTETSSKDASLANKTFNGYPHKFWPQFPMVKAVDLFFRVSNTLDWSILCFMEKCNPIMLWRIQVQGKAKILSPSMMLFLSFLMLESS